MPPCNTVDLSPCPPHPPRHHPPPPSLPLFPPPPPPRRRNENSQQDLVRRVSVDFMRATTHTTTLPRGRSECKSMNLGRNIVRTQA